MTRILHIAPFNTAGVPIAFAKAERALGIDSRLITFGRNPFGFEEDICLDLPWLDGRLFRSVRKKLSGAGRRAVRPVNGGAQPAPYPPVWSPGGPVETVFHALRERLWQARIKTVLEELDFYGFDIYQFDGGLDFTRHGAYAKDLHDRGKKIVCCYLGSDLRIRGVIPEMDAVSDINFTVEFDHLKLHPRIRYLFFPFDPWKFQPRAQENERLRLFHSATNRRYKGSDCIIDIGKKLERAYNVEFVFLENTPHDALLTAKRQSDIVIDQITNLGGVGYGVSSLEALSMGIPVCTRLTPEYEAFIPDHPFVHVTPETLYERLVELIRNPGLRRRRGQQGRRWVEQYHDAGNVVKHMLEVYREHGWL